MSGSSSRYSQLVAEDVAYHKAATPLSEMPSCTNLFDKWAQCFALGPQLKAVYRYGGFQDCRHKLDDFKFCLTMRGMSVEEKYEAWIQRKAQQTAEKRLGRQSAENVWESRRYVSPPQLQARPRGQQWVTDERVYVLAMVTTAIQTNRSKPMDSPEPSYDQPTSTSRIKHEARLSSRRDDSAVGILRMQRPAAQRFPM